MCAVQESEQYYNPSIRSCQIILELFLSRDISFLYDIQVDGDDDDDDDDDLAKEDRVSNFYGNLITPNII